MHFYHLQIQSFYIFNRVLSANVLTFVIVGYSVHCLATDAKFTFGILWKYLVVCYLCLGLQKVGKFSVNFGKFLGIWKVSGHFGNLSGILESFWTFWKFIGNFGKFLDILETYREL